MPKLRSVPDIIALHEIGTVYEDDDGRPFIEMNGQIGQIVGVRGGAVLLQQYNATYVYTPAEKAV